MNIPAQVALMRVQPHGAGRSNHRSNADGDSMILPMAPQRAIHSPLFDLAPRLVFPPPARSGDWITCYGAIGRIALPKGLWAAYNN